MKPKMVNLRHCCGPGFGVFSDGKCVTCGRLEGITKAQAHYNALKASHDRLLEVCRAFNRAITLSNGRAVDWDSLCDQASQAIAQAEALEK